MTKKLILATTAALLLIGIAVRRSSCQVRLSGTVINGKTQAPLPGATILLPGGFSGTFSDNRGRFNLVTERPVPFDLIVSAIGYRSDTIRITSSGTLNITLVPSFITSSEIVVAASRVPENIMESPVSIEHIDLQTLRQTPSASFYDVLANVKGVDMVTSGLLFNTPTTRGFGGSGNVGLNQLVDGMDNQAPGLNFSVGNVVGISDLDIANMELLPGASSALYGAGGTNGTLLLTSKDPFQYQGFSALAKGGLTHINDPQHKGATPYQQYVLRYDKAFNHKIAFKINAEYIKAYDWIASDYRDYDKTHFMVKQGDRMTDPAYDGINTYGDETSANIQSIANAMAQAGAIPPQLADLVPNESVTRTGYAEKDLVDYHTYNLKLGATVAYQVTPSLRATLEGHWGEGTTVYTGTDRYALKNFNIGQYKIQVDGRHFMVRAYTTQEDAGDAYNATALGQLMNEGWKPSYDPSYPPDSWYIQYISAFLAAKGTGSTDALAQQAGRNFADQGMPQPGSGAFGHLKDSVNSLPIPAGARFKDRSSLYHYEGLYNFAGQISFIDLQAGADYRTYRLNSGGTIFDDQFQKITIDQWGLFVQASKKLAKEKLKLTGAIRYDKTDNFQGKWTPRIAAIYTVASHHNIRLSYQTGYQLPTNQDQYIDLSVQQGRLIGGLPQFISKYNLNNNPGFLVPVVEAYGDAFTKMYRQNLQSGDADEVAQYKAAVSAEAVLKDNNGSYKQYHFGPLRPETVRSFELGYRGIIRQRLTVDAYGYYSSYQNKIVSIFLVQAPLGPQPFPNSADPSQYYGPQLVSDASNKYQTKVNSQGDINTWGWAIGAGYMLPGDFRVTANMSYNKLSQVPDGVFAQFNTPDYRVNVGIGKQDLFKGLGFQLNYRFLNAYTYEGAFAIGHVPAAQTLDAQLSYPLPRYKLRLQLGGTNILNHYYRNAFGNPLIGALYYFSVGYNIF